MFSAAKALSPAPVILAAAVAQGMEAERLPDPTRPPSLHQAAVRRLAEPQRKPYVVSAIKVSGDDRKAIVNGQLLSEGERIGEAVIVQIDLGAIVIEYLSERRRYKLLPYEIRRAHENSPVEE